jgi:peroxiredoxin Q/BCP
VSALQVGDKAPDIRATTHQGEPFSLAQLATAGRTVVLFFYPRDNTAICTAEACAFRDAYEQFSEAGASVVGVSSDSAASHQQFAAKHRLPFALLSDDKGDIRAAFGVPKTWGIFPGRVTYVIDSRGIVRHIFNSQFTADRHVTQARDIVKQLVAEKV